MAGLTGLGGMSKAFDLERGEIGPDLFRAACRLGLEGLVSKPRDRSYQGGPSRHWVKEEPEASGHLSRDGALAGV
jgi:ATP-dependent DNA ligase